MIFFDKLDGDYYLNFIPIITDNKISFERNTEDNKKQILDKEKIKLPVKSCNNMINKNAREKRYSVYQSDIGKESQLFFLNSIF